ncbi:MAG: sugar-binding domain-containing protein [Bacteroidota bacterium]
MYKLLKPTFVIFFLLWVYEAHAQIKQGPLMTEWSAQVDPDHPLPEYPRPQLARTAWMNLNGTWQYQPANPNDLLPTGNLSGKIIVPFPVESALSGVMEYHDRLWYKRTFTTPAAWAGKNIWLHFGAVDWESEVFINGISVGTHQGGYDPFSFDITPYLTTGTQTIVVRVYDPTDKAGQPRGKQTTHPEGIWYTPATGIWQTVWLEPVSSVAISQVAIVPDIDKSQVQVTVSATGTTANTQATVVVKDGANVVATLSGTPGTLITLPVNQAKLWSPTSPFLYDVIVSLTESGTSTDSVTSYFGMRKIHMTKVGRFPRILLNNQVIYQYGPLDQGYWPDGIYTAPTDEALKWDLQKTKELGFNMTRKHIKVEPARWYYWADKLGLLVWQDMPSGFSNGDRSTAEKQHHIEEMKAMIKQLKNHPSIVMWIVFNEGWGQFETSRVAQIALDADPTRLVSGASGWVDAEIGHIIDSHSYPAPSMPSNPNRAAVNGEFGGVALNLPGHVWPGNGGGYITVGSTAEVTKHFSQFSEDIFNYSFSGLCASVYTQLTDVENETNGLVTYDRKINKVDVATVRASVEKCLQAATLNYEFLPILPTADMAGQIWRYSITKPGDNWFSPSYDDSNWKNGLAGFGTIGTPGSTVRTNWNTADIWLRKSFSLGNLSEEALKNIRLKIHHDETCQVYINGILAFEEDGWTSNYRIASLTEAARTSLKINSLNTISIHCHQENGGQYIDAGFSTLVTPGTVIDLLITGMEKLELDSLPAIYPNPSTGLLHLKNAQRHATFEIITCEGKIIQKGQVNGDQIDVSNTRKGTYLLRLSDSHGMTTKVIILQ